MFGESFDPDTVHTLVQSVIITQKNADTFVINDKVLKLLPCVSRTYYSADSIVPDDPTEIFRFPVEFLQKQTPSGMAPHVLNLKIGAIVMLLRTLGLRFSLT